MVNVQPVDIAQEEQRLSSLAMQFRGTREDAQRRAIADDYGETVRRLIDTRQWNEVPPLEDQLPPDWMPPEFFDHWLKHTT